MRQVDRIGAGNRPMSWYVLISMLVLYLRQKRSIFLNATLLAAIVLVITGFTLDRYHHRQEYFMVLNVRELTVLQYIAGTKAHLITTDTSSAARDRVMFATSNGWDRLRVDDQTWYFLMPDTIISQPGAGLVIHQGYFMAGPVAGYIAGFDAHSIAGGFQGETPRVAIITAGFNRTSLDMVKDLSPDMVVIDSSVPWYRMDSLNAILRRLDLVYHNVNEDGAWILDLKDIH